LLDPSDLLVLNETKVTPARLFGHKPTGGRVELLVLDPARPLQGQQNTEHAQRVCLVQSSKPVRPGTVIHLDKEYEIIAGETLSPGRIIARFPVSEPYFLPFLESYGTPPLPPYIKPENRLLTRDRDRYQTVYAKINGSVAAPTAGLHFTEELFNDLRTLGITIARIVLHVGPGTFTPVRSEDVRLHNMESEFFEVSEETAGLINDAQKQGRRIVAVGTTCVRALESAVNEDGILQPGSQSTDLFITPGYKFKLVRGLVTNFHLPKSTLLMLVCALAGTDLTLNAYKKAIENKYRFYSYGDACLILE
jgi:S-adenosylmethionine:tRNA ribosyltransferase-isomerase